MTRRRVTFAPFWAALAALTALAARSLAYALAPPDPLRPGLQHAAGGTRLVVAPLVVLGFAFGLALAVLWLAAAGVRERAELSGRAPERHLRVSRAGANAALLALGACASFAGLESYLHLRAGLGWHGLHCLAGPVHANVLPIICALSVLAAAAVEAIRHVLAWARRTIRLLLDVVGRRGPGPTIAATPGRSLRPFDEYRGARPRAPPLPV